VSDPVDKTGPRKADDQFGPQYPDLGAKVAKLRKGKDRKAHGEAVLDAIRTKNKPAAKAPSAARVACASGTYLNNGRAIVNAVVAQQRSALASCMAAIRAARTDEEIKAAYAAAMEEKRQRENPQQEQPTNATQPSPKRRRRARPSADV